jgi:hypothetical protein
VPVVPAWHRTGGLGIRSARLRLSPYPAVHAAITTAIPASTPNALAWPDTAPSPAARYGAAKLEGEDGTYRMGTGGAAEFGGFGIDVDRLEHRTRPLLRPCMDWSERRYHLAGSLGAALTTAFAERRWIVTREASRIVTVTEAGQTGLRAWLGTDLAELRVAA